MAVDVKDALFSMHPDKAPGPDGMNPAFYQKFWHIVGRDISYACLQFIANKELPMALNKTLIVLIPKKAHPEVLLDMRPIALSNVLYKIIAKMLANRLKLVLDTVISNPQSAFDPGRAITDNILISAEIMHFLKRKRQGNEGVAALKIDMAKAYDRVEWDFLRAIMLKIGFAAEWVQLIMLCITTISYNVLRDGNKCVNYAKSSISFSMNVKEDIVQQICSILGVTATSNHGPYLGLPSHIGRKRSDVFHFVKETVWKKLQGWSMKYLSRAGKEILLKTVAQAVPNFLINIYLLPLELCKELEIMMNSFWWAGGIGFKKLRAFNLAMLGKQGWRLLTKPNSLVAQIFKARYYSRTTFAEATLGHNPSYAWRLIMAAKQVVINGSRIQIGDGKQTFIGTDPWLPDSECGFTSTVLSEHVQSAPVSSLIVPSTRTWDHDILNDIFDDRDKNLILKIPLSERRTADLWYWMREPKGAYTVRSSYKNRNAMVWRGKSIGHDAVCWETPLGGRLKCNVDAAVFDSRGQIGLGSVIRDSTGAFVAARCRCICG
ncbi:uncharacterized protein LOC127899877 [Citrus sinensis]|uniref:uncharacterized protein LOC112099556 n=1 Tax=Citrus clementina TaxID=85681 RepID=UPI000CED680B|nr:uncharacterized protein LOC112099556 [Citrus x clementina]XP_052289977.1 uncharacterized protein LOC127899877 [Citrus sinensis]